MRKLIVVLCYMLIGFVNSQNENENENMCRTSTDIVVVTDGSLSIGENGHIRLKEWVLQLPLLFEMGPENVNIGLVAFSTHAYKIQPLTSSATTFNNTVYYDLDWLCPEFNTLRCPADVPCYSSNSYTCQTGTGIGMEMAYQMLRNSTRINDEYTNQVMIIITDGYWNLGIPPIEVISNHNDMNVTRVVITVGSNINHFNALSYASSGPANDTERFLINSNNFEELNDTLPYMLRTVCETGVVVPPVEPPPEIIDPPPAEIVGNDFPLAALAAVPVVAALAAIPFLLRGKKPPPVVELEEEPEMMESPIIMESMPAFIEPNMDTDTGAIGAPPAPPNRPLYAPASRAYIGASGKFSGGSHIRSHNQFISP